MSHVPGRTSEQMLMAPPKAVYLWPVPASISYARHLAEFLNRRDLRIVTPDRLDPGDDLFRGRPREERHLVLDHACPLHLSFQAWRRVNALLTYLNQ